MKQTIKQRTHLTASIVLIRPDNTAMSLNQSETHIGDVSIKYDNESRRCQIELRIDDKDMTPQEVLDLINFVGP